MLEVVTRLFGCWKFIAHWSYDQVSVALLSPSDTKKQTPRFQARAHSTNSENTPHPCWYTKSQPPNRAPLGQDGRRQTQDERENPGNRAKPRILAKFNMRTGHLHLVVLKRQTSLVLLLLERSKEGSSLLVNLRLPSTTRQKHELATDCWSKR